MNEKFLTANFKNVHISGVLGVSTSAIAKHLLLKNYAISGSDANKNGDFSELMALGVKVYKKHCRRNIKGVDAVIRSSAISDDNPEVKCAKRKNIPVYERSQILGEILSCYKTPIAVSGSHGKTTTTALIADALIVSGKNPTVFLGGESSAYGNYRAGEEDFVIAEACEYKKNFLNIKPKISVVLNIDNDHLDSFNDMEDMAHAFNAFIKGSIAVLNADDDRVRKLESCSSVTYAIKNNATFTASKIKLKDGAYTFNVNRYGKTLGRIKLRIIGRHNIYNALATVAVCDLLKISFNDVKKAIESFSGVKRRAELIGEVGDCVCYADYAHHPKEISSTINAFADTRENFAVVFQPHTYSRTKILMDDFISALKSCKDVVIYKTYPAREKFDELGSEETLYKNLRKTIGEKCKLANTPKELSKLIEDLSKKYKRIVFLGAGDVYQIAIDLIKKMPNK